jgi:hypothetical protein
MADARKLHLWIIVENPWGVIADRLQRNFCAAGGQRGGNGIAVTDRGTLLDLPSGSCEGGSREAMTP